MIRIRGLSVRYGPVEALRGLDLDVAEGDCLLITGPSGCGKSTLARALAGLIPHAIPAELSGAVWVNGQDTQAHTVAQLAHHVGIVLQNPASQLFHLTVAEEVAFGPRNVGLPEDEVQRRVAWALEATGLGDFGGRRPAALSGGEQQRVAIAAVLAMLPRVLVLDEPTASLDLEGTRAVLDTLGSLNRDLGITIVLVEHRLAPAIPMADRLVIMDQGRIVRQGPPRALLQDRALRDEFGLRRPRTTPTTPWQELLEPLPRHPDGVTPLLALEKVTAGYGRQEVVHDLDLTLYPGDFAAAVGPNGAGKTTLALLAAGLLKPFRGRVVFSGAGRPRPGRDVTLLFQNPVDQLFTDTVGEEIAFGPHNYGRFDPGFQAEILAQADLAQLQGRCPTHLSVGQQQRTALAACAALRPHLLILDEPTLGQDWSHLQGLMDFVLRLNHQGTAILLISHDYKLIYRYAQRVFLLEGGRLTFTGRPQSEPAAPHKERALCASQPANW